MQILICEDEQICLSAIRDDILLWQKMHMYQDVYVREFSSAEDLLEAFEKGVYCDLLFLDIYMPDGLDGYALSKKIREINQKIQIVFVTNSVDFLREGYTVGALRYFTKPVTRNQIFEVLDIVYAQMNALEGKFFTAKSSGGQMFIPLREILFFEIRGHNLLLYTTTKKEPVAFRMRLKYVLDQFEEERCFVCPHRSFLVNIAFVRAAQDNKLVLANGMEIPISRSCSGEVRKALYLYFQGGKRHVGMDAL